MPARRKEVAAEPGKKEGDYMPAEQRSSISTPISSLDPRYPSGPEKIPFPPPPQSQSQLSQEIPKETLHSLIESNLVIEKVAVDLLDSMSKLIERIDRMLSLFEGAARKIDEGEILREPLAKQLQELLEQNKTIARGLLMLEKYVRERSGEMKELPRTV